MPVLAPVRARTLLTPLVAALVLAACATGKPTRAPDKAPERSSDSQSSSTDDSSAGQRPATAPAAKPRPPRPDKDAKDTKDKLPTKPAGKDVEVIVEEAPPEPPLVVGPAWLSQCVSRQMEGGVIRCDADKLLATPSARVKVFTREPSAAGRMAGGSIQVRANLPRKYRFFVVP